MTLKNTDNEYRIKVSNRQTIDSETDTIEVPMEIETQRIVSKLDENGGTIELVYTLTVQGEKYFNDMKITVSKR